MRDCENCKHYDECSKDIYHANIERDYSIKLSNRDCWENNDKNTEYYGFISELVRICDSDDFDVDYDKYKGMYRVIIYNEKDNKIKEIWFDAYEYKEVDDRVEKIVDKIEKLKISSKEILDGKADKGIKLVIRSEEIEYFLNLLLEYIKDLSEEN